MSDGAITFTTALDNKELEKQLNSLTKKINSLEDRIGQKRAERMPLAEQADQLAVSLDAAKAKLYEMHSAVPGAFSSDQIKEQQIHVNGLQAEWNGVQGRVERYDAAINSATLELDRNKEKAGAVTQELGAASGAANMMGPALSRASGYLDRILTRIKRLASRVLFFSVIMIALRSLRKWFGNVIKSNDQAAAAIARLKAALLTMAQPLINVIIPAFTALVRILTQVVTAIAKFTSMLAGTTVEESAAAAESLNKETEALDDAGAAAKKASKSFAAFDEINQLSSGDSGGGAESSSTAPDFTSLLNGIKSKLEITMDDILFKWKGLTGEQILKKFTTGLTAIAGGIIGFAVGGVGGAALGITLGATAGIIISALLFDGDGKLNNEEILKSIIFALTVLAGGILGFVSGGPLGAAIGVTIGAGITLAISKLMFNGDGKLSPEEILSLIVLALTSIVGGILGFMVGGPAGAALGIFVGADVGLMIKKMIFNGDGKLTGAEIARLIVVALGMLVGGIIGFAVGGPFGALIGVTVGAGVTLAISQMVVDNWDKIKVFFAALWDDIKNELDSGWNNIKVWWSTKVGPKLTLSFWQGKFDPIRKALTQKIKDAVNGGIALLNQFIDWVNDKMHFEWDGLTIAGKEIIPAGSVQLFSLPHIPALAQGAVIPPNREFLAMLGDQKSGTNIEAPLETIVEAFRRAGGGDITINNVMTIDGEVVYRNQKKVSRRHGVSFAE